MDITNEDWIKYRNNATKYLEQHNQYATKKAVQVAIDKQIAIDAFVYQETVICPICDALLDDVDEIPKWLKEGYCFRCGQKLKW